MPRKTVKQSRSMKPFYIGLGAIAAVGAVYLITQASGGGGSAATQPVQVVIDPAELARVQGISVGREDAPVVIYEFADFQCPGCGHFATFTAPIIKDRLVANGTARFVYYDFPLQQHPHAFLAARAARCANEQGRFWEYHDLLYGRQATWSGMRDATDFFLKLGETAGLEENAFESCVLSDRFQEEVSRSLQLGQMLGVRSTPSLFVNLKRLDGVPDYPELEQIVLAEAGAAPASGPAATGDTAATADSAAPAAAAPAQ